MASHGMVSLGTWAGVEKVNTYSSADLTRVVARSATGC